MRAVFIVAALAMLAACGQAAAPTSEEETPVAETPAVPQTRAEATAQDTCGASAFAGLVGAQLAAATMPPGARVVTPDAMITQDFRADRVNIVVDAQGVITSVECF